MKKLSIVPAQTNINFIKQKFLAFGLSILLIILSGFFLSSKGLNFGIDFTGGIVVELRTENEIELGNLRKSLNVLDLGEISLQTIGSNNDLMIRVQKQEGGNDEQMAAVNVIKENLAKNFDEKIDYRKVDFVGPQVGHELIQSGALALILSFVAIMIYIWIRFEWQFGLGAIAALIHDSIITLGLFSFLQLEFNLTSIAAILTIIGYSINDSVVIFDRIRESLRKYKKKSIEEVLNRSINDTLSRTIITAGTTIAALVALVWLGGAVVKGFSIAVLFGVIIGTYSSIYIAAPILIFMDIRGEKKAKDQEVTA